DPRHQARLRPLLLGGAGLQPGHRPGQPAGSEPQRMPAVTEAHGPAQRGVAAAADPDRDLPAPVVAVVLPGRADGGQVLVGQPAAVTERDPERVELLAGPAD